jgi:hypothetical protein
MSDLRVWPYCDADMPQLPETSAGWTAEAIMMPTAGLASVIASGRAALRRGAAPIPPRRRGRWLLAGFALGGTAWIRTLAYALAIGPLIHLPRPRLSVAVPAVGPSWGGPDGGR